MSKSGYYGDFGSMAEEQRAYDEHIQEQEQEPEVVPCFRCKCQMYEESREPEKNTCRKCRDEYEFHKEVEVYKAKKTLNLLKKT